MDLTATLTGAHCPAIAFRYKTIWRACRDIGSLVGFEVRHTMGSRAMNEFQV
jgi:hypothetical protein